VAGRRGPEHGRADHPGLLAGQSIDVEPDAYYMVTHNLMQNFTYTHDVLQGEQRALSNLVEVGVGGPRRGVTGMSEALGSRAID
jgi:hypothetical protein